MQGIILVSILLTGIPVCVYFSVKFGRYGYLKATELHTKDQQRRNGTN